MIKTTKFFLFSELFMIRIGDGDDAHGNRRLSLCELIESANAEIRNKNFK